MRGLAILVKGSQIIRLCGLKCRIRPQSGNGSHLALMNNFHQWACECPDILCRHVVCKHVCAVKFSLSLRERITSQSRGVSSNAFAVCKKCRSESLVKNNVRRHKSGSVQRCSCKECGYQFSNNIGLEDHLTRTHNSTNSDETNNDGTTTVQIMTCSEPKDRKS